MNTLDDLRVAIAFLTRLPARAGVPEASDVGRSAALFPLVGLGLGLALAAVARGLESRLPETVVGLVLVAVLAALTGGFHLDGLADVFDGLGGGRGDRERTLALMRDGRIGAHGATALFLVIAAKVLALAALLPAASLRLVVVLPAIARWLAVVLIAAFPAARDAGLGRALKDHVGAREVAISSAIALVAILWAGSPAPIAAAAAAIVSLAWGGWIARRLGGLTGDVYGAAIELAEVAFLIVAIAR